MSLVRNFVEQDYADRVQQFSGNICPIDQPRDRVSNWSRLGAMTVFMTGVFDIPTPNHRFGLAEARLMAGAICLGVDYESLTEDASDDLKRDVMNEAASDRVKLVVSVDTDESVARRKAFHPEKGNCPKPILGWPTRAYNLASYTVPRLDGSNHTMVDYVTRHGIDSCQVCVECPSRNIALMVVTLQPKLVVINAASVTTLRAVLSKKECGQLPDTAIGLTKEQHNQFEDELLDGRVSSTSIIRRARGEQ